MTPSLPPKSNRLAALLLAATLTGPAFAQAGSTEPAVQASRPAASTTKKLPPDHSGRQRYGMASYYGPQFHGRKMADGSPMRPESNNAASRTLPLGTVALVTNLRNGRHAVVTIRDRGPYAKGRLIDLSPATAKQLGFIQAGVTPVQVTPLIVPPPSGDALPVVALSASSAGNNRR